MSLLIRLAVFIISLVSYFLVSLSPGSDLSWTGILIFNRFLFITRDHFLINLCCWFHFIFIIEMWYKLRILNRLRHLVINCQIWGVLLAWKIRNVRVIVCAIWVWLVWPIGGNYSRVFLKLVSQKAFLTHILRWWSLRFNLALHLFNVCI